MKSLGAVVAVLLLLAGGAAFLFYAHSNPSTAALDGDIAQLRAQIDAADAEDKNYAGGAIKALIEFRAQMLRGTEAMLEQKRASVLRRIDLRYTVEGKTLAPASPAQLASMEQDIEKAKAAVAADEAEAARYTGGLLQAMKLMTASEDRLNLAQLTMAYYSAKYGLAPPPLKGPEAAPPKPVAPGKVVPDKDAL